MDREIESLREQRQKLTNYLDENPNDSTSRNKLTAINEQIQKLLADKKRKANLLPMLLQEEADRIADRKKNGVGLMVKLGVKYWAIQYVMLYTDDYPLDRMPVKVSLPDSATAMSAILKSDQEFMAPKQLAENLVMAFPDHFKLL